MDYFEKTELEVTKKTPLPPHKASKQTWVSRLSVLWLLILWQVSQNAVIIPMNKHGQFSLWKIGLFLIIFAICVILSYQWARKYHLIPAIQWRYFQFGKIAMGFGLMFAVALISGLIMHLTGTKSTANQDVVDAIGKMLPPVIFFIMTTSAGFFEELIFRVSSFELIFNKWPKIAALFAWGLFTLAHNPTNIASFVTYGLMSLVLTGLYIKYRNFYLNLSVHFLWNAFGMIVFFMAK